MGEVFQLQIPKVNRCKFCHSVMPEDDLAYLGREMLYDGYEHAYLDWVVYEKGFMKIEHVECKRVRVNRRWRTLAEYYLCPTCVDKDDSGKLVLNSENFSKERLIHQRFVDFMKRMTITIKEEG